MSNTNRNLKRENEIRRQKTAKARQDKVVVGYIMAKHPGVYEEALNFAKEVDRNNPKKMDLTKTTQFQALVKDPGFTDNMELKIKLLDKEKPSTSSDLKAATLDGENVAPLMQDDLMQDSSVEENAAPLMQDDLMQDSSVENLLPLSEEEFNTVINDLGQDPDIQNFFANIDFELDNCPMW